MKAAFAAVVLFALAITAGAGGAAAASPGASPPDTLGASLGPVPIRADDPSPSVAVTNRSTIPVDVSLSLSGDPGYTLKSMSLQLAPDERVLVPFLALGKGQATVTATISAAAPPTGTEAVSIALSTIVRHRTLLETILASPAWPLVPIVGLSLVLVALWAVRRKVTR